MKVSELIKALQKMPQDLEVYGYTDHGQTPEKISSPSIAFTNITTHSLWEDWTLYEDEATDNEYETKFVIL